MRCIMKGIMKGMAIRFEVGLEVKEGRVDTKGRRGSGWRKRDVVRNVQQRG